MYCIGTYTLTQLRKEKLSFNRCAYNTQSFLLLKQNKEEKMKVCTIYTPAIYSVKNLLAKYFSPHDYNYNNSLQFSFVQCTKRIKTKM